MTATEEIAQQVSYEVPGLIARERLEASLHEDGRSEPHKDGVSLAVPPSQR